MSALIAELVGKYWVTIAAAGAFLAGIIGVYAKARSDGKAAEKAKQQEAELKARDIRDQVQNDVGAMSPEQKRKELGKWSL